MKSDFFENSIGNATLFKLSSNMDGIATIGRFVFSCGLYSLLFIADIFTSFYQHSYTISTNIEKYVKTKSPNASASTSKHWWCGEYTIA